MLFGCKIRLLLANMVARTWRTSRPLWSSSRTQCWLRRQLPGRKRWWVLFPKLWRGVCREDPDQDDHPRWSRGVRRWSNSPLDSPGRRTSLQGSCWFWKIELKLKIGRNLWWYFNWWYLDFPGRQTSLQGSCSSLLEEVLGMISQLVELS